MTSLDLYILMLLKRGINTPYSLRTRGGISLGASLPAIRRLLDRHLVKEIAGGTRGKREFQPTKMGERELGNLEGYLERALKDSTSDIASDLRMVACAVASGKRQVAIDLLEKAVLEYSSRSDQLAGTLPDLLAEGDLASLYLGLTGYCENQTLRSYAESLRSLASHFGNQRTPPTSGRRTSRRSRR